MTREGHRKYVLLELALHLMERWKMRLKGSSRAYVCCRGKLGEAESAGLFEGFDWKKEPTASGHTPMALLARILGPQARRDNTFMS